MGRLIDLNPRWITGKRGYASEAEGKRGHIGVTFECPCCRGTERATRLGVLFEPPIDDGILWLWSSWEPIPGHRWQRLAGETFETLSLSPSIDAESNHGHWHGYLTNGEIR